MSFAKPKNVEYFRITEEVWSTRRSYPNGLPDWAGYFDIDSSYKWTASNQINSNKGVDVGFVLIKVSKDSCYAMPGWKFDMLYETIED